MTDFRPICFDEVDGNAFSIMNAVKRVLEANGKANQVSEYMSKATSGDYDNLVNVPNQYVHFMVPLEVDTSVVDEEEDEG